MKTSKQENIGLIVYYMGSYWKIQSDHYDVKPDYSYYGLVKCSKHGKEYKVIFFLDSHVIHDLLNGIPWMETFKM